MACPHCGSWSVKADRSLAGRLVCGRCGRPLGGAAGRGASKRNRRRRVGGPAGRLPWWGWLAALVALSAALAQLQPPQRSPWPGAGGPVQSPSSALWH
jgi:hypothetical protein